MISAILSTYLQKIQKENGAIIINGEIENYQEIVEGLAPQVITYGMSDACDFYPADITFNEKACANFTAMYHGEKVMDVALNVPGLHKCFECTRCHCACP